MTETNGTASYAVRICTGAESRSQARRLVTAARDEAATATVHEVGPTGVGDLDPLVLVTGDGETAVHTDVSADAVRALVRAVESGDSETAEDAHAVVAHESDTRTLPIPDEGPLAVGRRRVLSRAGWTVPGEVADDERLAADVVADDPEATAELVRHTGLLGRGRGDASTDEPVVEEWDRARKTMESGSEPVLVVNANEADERNRTDSLLLESDPASVVDGALAVADLLGIEDVVCYTREGDDLACERLESAVDAVCERLSPPKRPQVVAGPDRYIAGEMTMALESLEGNDRLEARLRPPTPAQHGLYGRPTLIHTPRTLAQLRRLWLHPDEFDTDDADPGTRLVTVSGDVAAPATVELPTGGSLAAVRAAVTLDGPFKMACVGGQFGGLTRSLDHPPSAPALSGAGLGTHGAVELLDDSRCAVATAGKRARVAEEENCGRCVPCREGSVQLTDLLRAVYGGDYRGEAIRELARVMRTTSTCDFGQAAARPVTTAMDAFETEFRAHVEGRCPSGECEAGRPAERGSERGGTSEVSQT